MPSVCNAQCLNVECSQVKYPYAECSFAERYYSKCNYAECHGAQNLVFSDRMVIAAKFNSLSSGLRSAFFRPAKTLLIPLPGIGLL